MTFGEFNDSDILAQYKPEVARMVRKVRFLEWLRKSGPILAAAMVSGSASNDMISVLFSNQSGRVKR